jgi:hypothetical protein
MNWQELFVKHYFNFLPEVEPVGSQGALFLAAGIV